MKYRIFQSEPDMDTGDSNLILIPENKLEKMYSLDGYYYKNHDYDPDEYDEEYEETHEYRPFDSSDVSADYKNTEIYELFDGIFEIKEDFQFDEPIGEYEEEWTPNGAKYHYYVADWDTGWTEVTDEYQETMSDLTLVGTNKGSYGENEFYINKVHDRYFAKHISYMQGAGRDTYTEMDEDEFLHSVLHNGLEKEHYEDFPSITGMTNQEQFMQHILSQPDNSIVNPETIRQISLLLRNKISKQHITDLTSKIKRGYEYHGLYPDALIGNMNDTIIDTSHLSNADDVKEMLNDFLKLRLKHKQ